jgi:hypothetical protein
MWSGDSSGISLLILGSGIRYPLTTANPLCLPESPLHPLQLTMRDIETRQLRCNNAVLNCQDAPAACVRVPA